MKEEEIRKDKGFWITLTIAGLALWKIIDILGFLTSGILTWITPQ